MQSLVLLSELEAITHALLEEDLPSAPQADNDEPMLALGASLEHLQASMVDDDGDLLSPTEASVVAGLLEDAEIAASALLSDRQEELDAEQPSFEDCVWHARRRARVSRACRRSASWSR